MKPDLLNSSITLGEYVYQTICQNFQKFVEPERDIFKDKDTEPLH